MNLQPTLSDNLVVLKPLVNEHFDALYSVASDKLLWEQHPNYDRYKKDVFQDFFQKALESKGAFTIIDSKNKKVIGSSRFYDLNKKDNSIVIGYTFIDRNYWGSSYNSAIKKLMIEYAFQFVDVIEFHVGETNFRSQKAVEKLGAIKIGEIKDDTSSKTNWVYQLNKSQI